MPSSALPDWIDRPSTKLRLVCLPYAGGTASLFADWSTRLPPSVEVCAMELPGHGRRMGEPCVDRLEPLVDTLVGALERIPARPTIVFGHSFGARLAFALARRVPGVVGLVVSGARAPALPAPRPCADLPREEFLRVLEALGGTPSRLLEDPELLDAYLPIVRADMRALETAAVASLGDRVSCPVTVLAAVDDPLVPFADAAAWQVHAGGDFRLVPMEGGHFFITSRRALVIREVAAACRMGGATLGGPWLESDAEAVSG